MLLKAKGSTEPAAIITLTAQLEGGISNTATIHVTTGLFSVDELQQSYQSAGPPAVALVEAGGSWSSINFVDLHDAGTLATGKVALFSAERESAIRTTILNTSRDVIDFTGVSRPLAIPVQIWAPNFDAVEGWNALTVAGVIGNDIADAKRTLRLNRVGVTLDVKPFKYYEAAEAFGTDCEGVRPSPIPEMLNVYYLPTALDSAETGLFCKSPDYQPGILISLRLALPTTLVHEIGHALSIDHTESEPGFEDNPNNVMRVPQHDTPDSRSHFSIGQAFRMNWDLRSWLFTTAWVSRWGKPCNPTAATVDCPALKEDIR